MMEYKFDRIEDAIQDVRAGKLVIVMDAKDREYEGDFIGAASKTTGETINFLTTYARGAFIAVFTPHGLCDKLEIPPMSTSNDSFNDTKFRVAVDSKVGKSGSSAIERAETVRLLGEPNSKSSDFVRPGHVVPIQASEGGILARQGHTEAGVTLAELAGFHPPVAVDLEILDDDGSMAKEKKLFELAKRFDLKIITIDDLVTYVKAKSKPASQVSPQASPA